MKQKRVVHQAMLPSRMEWLAMPGYPNLGICGMDIWRQMDGGFEYELLEDEEIKNLIFAIFDNRKTRP